MQTETAAAVYGSPKSAPPVPATCGQCAGLTPPPGLRVRRCQCPRASRFGMICAADTPACSLFDRAGVQLELGAR